MSNTNNTVPRHVGLILDGNRRWAKAKGLPTSEGYRQAAERFKQISLSLFGQGVEYVSAYVWSSENWSRPKDEVSFLMGFVIKVAETQLDEFHQKGVKIVVLGSREGLSDQVAQAVNKTVEKTKNNTDGTLALCFNYGGKQEIVDAAKAAVAGGEELTIDSINRYIYHPEVPPIDLLIRTSGEKRLSGYMLWRSDYAELYFSDVMWPDFDEAELEKALNDYAERQRRFGS